MKVLVTGGAGYIGTELVRCLLNTPEVAEVVVYDNLSRGAHGLFFTSLNNPEKLHFIKGDILDNKKLKKVLAGVDLVYHLAALVSTPFAHENSHAFEQINHWGTAELAYQIETSDVKRVIYTSSASIYGFSDEPLGETAKPNPATHYGISKLNGERILAELRGKEVLTLRCGNVYGHGSCIRFDSVINKFMFDAHYYGRISISGNGHQYRSFLHVDLIARALAKLVTFPLASGVYNLTHLNLTVNEVAKTLKTIYPALEKLYIEQDMPLRSLLIQPHPVCSELFPVTPGTLDGHLRTFASKFSFGMAQQ